MRHNSLLEMLASNYSEAELEWDSLQTKLKRDTNLKSFYDRIIQIAKKKKEEGANKTKVAEHLIALFNKIGTSSKLPDLKSALSKLTKRELGFLRSMAVGVAFGDPSPKMQPGFRSVQQAIPKSVYQLPKENK